MYSIVKLGLSNCRSYSSNVNQSGKATGPNALQAANHNTCFGYYMQVMNRGEPFARSDGYLGL
jgi:hypothetical protein